jgi:hypothetical protein
MSMCKTHEIDQTVKSIVRRVFKAAPEEQQNDFPYDDIFLSVLKDKEMDELLFNPPSNILLIAYAYIEYLVSCADFDGHPVWRPLNEDEAA